MTEKNVIAIDDPKSEKMNSSMTPRINSRDEDGPNDEFVDKRASNEYDSSEGFSTFNNVQLLAAKKKAEVAAEQSEITPILLEKQATSVIECIAECAEEGKDQKKKNFGDELDDKSNFLIKCLCMVEDLFENFTRYGIHEKDFYSGNLQLSRNSKQEFKVLGSIKDTIREKDADINHPKKWEDVVSTYIRETIKSDDVTRSLDEKNVDSASREPSVIQKEDEAEIEGFCHISGCDSGISEGGSLQGFINQEYIHNEHREEEDDKTGQNDDIKSEDGPCVNEKTVDGASSDPGVIQKQDETENEGSCHMLECDSGVSERKSQQEGVDNEHHNGEEDDKADLNDDIKSEDLCHSPGVNGRNVGRSSRDHGDTQTQDVTENVDIENSCHKCDSGFSDLGSQHGFTSQENGENEHCNGGEDDKTVTDIHGPLQDDPTSEALDQTLDTNPKDRGRDSDRVQKKDVQENRHTSQVTTCDSGFSDREHLQIFASHEDSDGAHPAGKEDDESAVKRAESQSVDPVPNLNPDDKMTGVGDQGNIENQDDKGDSTSVILGADKAHNPQKQMSAKRDQGRVQTKEISTNHSARKKVLDSDASVLESLQDRKSRKHQDTRHHKEEHDDTKNRRDDRRPVLLDPDPNLSTTCTKRNTSATGDQGHLEWKPPAEKEDISHVTSCDSDASVSGSVRPPEGTSQKDCDRRKCPKEEGKVDVTDKNDAGGQRVYSKLDPELSCNISHGTKQAKVDPILQRPNKKKTLIKTGYSGVQIFRFPLFLIALICTPSVLSVLGNMNLVWYKEGDNAVIYFSFESYDAESAEMILNVRMQSVQKPFYSNGIIEYDGFKYDSQIERFNVSTDGKGLKIEITHFQREDEDVFIFTQISFRDNGDPDGLSRRIQVKLLTPAQCNVLSGSSLIIVHCTDAVATPETAIFCFQGISFCSPYSRGDTADGQAEFRMKKSGEPIRCCSKAQVDPSVSISASHENCHDFIWLPTMPTIPTSTHDHDGVVTSSQGVSVDSDGDIAPYQTIPHTPSSCSRIRYVQCLIITLLLSWSLV